jgi:hypothetical protein
LFLGGKLKFKQNLSSNGGSYGVYTPKGVVWLGQPDEDTHNLVLRPDMIRSQIGPKLVMQHLVDSKRQLVSTILVDSERIWA